MVADIVRRVLSQENDVEVVASLEGIDGWQLVSETQEVDLVITAYRPSETELRRFDRALASRPGLRVLAIEGDGRTACMYALRPYTTQLGPLSPETLIEFVRASARSEHAWSQ
jgi:DNA-binding NarL/FixJ family response regulator